MKKINFQFNQKGFSLIEVLVAMSLFAILIVGVFGAFSTGINSIWNSFGHQNVQDAARFALESMGKEIRMSTVSTANGGPYSTIDIITAKDEAVEYSFADNQILRNGAPLNGDEALIEGQFYVQKTGGLLPRVTILLKATNNSIKETRQIQINLQTTVSSREYAQ